LRVQTHILVLAYRNPLLTAKSVLSLDVLSGGRVILGVASGYLKPEFAALGVDFDERNELADEAIDVMRLAWTTDEVAYAGRHFRTRGTTMRPRPPQHPHPPVWVGGNSTAAIHRAAARGQGWVPFPNPPAASRAVRTPQLATLDDLATRIERLRELLDRKGHTEPFDICFSPFSYASFGTSEFDEAALVEEIDALDAMGVTWCAFSAPPAATRTELLDAVTTLATITMRRERRTPRVSRHMGDR
jgi:probable F420-dependent oxidoreductase